MPAIRHSLFSNDCHKQYFDSGFYEDQHDERKLVVYPNKVTKEFADNDKARKIRETKSTAYTKSARVEGHYAGPRGGSGDV